MGETAEQVRRRLIGFQDKTGSNFERFYLAFEHRFEPVDLHSEATFAQQLMECHRALGVSQYWDQSGVAVDEPRPDHYTAVNSVTFSGLPEDGAPQLSMTLGGTDQRARSILFNRLAPETPADELDVLSRHIIETYEPQSLQIDRATTRTRRKIAASAGGLDDCVSWKRWQWAAMPCTQPLPDFVEQYRANGGCWTVVGNDPPDLASDDPLVLTAAAAASRLTQQTVREDARQLPRAYARRHGHLVFDRPFEPDGVPTWRPTFTIDRDLTRPEIERFILTAHQHRSLAREGRVDWIINSPEILDILGSALGAAGFSRDDIRVLPGQH